MRKGCLILNGASSFCWADLSASFLSADCGPLWVWGDGGRRGGPWKRLRQCDRQTRWGQRKRSFTTFLFLFSCTSCFPFSLFIYFNWECNYRYSDKKINESFWCMTGCIKMLKSYSRMGSKDVFRPGDFLQTNTVKFSDFLVRFATGS